MDSLRSCARVCENISERLLFMSFWAYVPLQVVKRITLQRLRLLFMSFLAYMVLQVVDLEVA